MTVKERKNLNLLLDDKPELVFSDASYLFSDLTLKKMSNFSSRKSLYSISDIIDNFGVDNFFFDLIFFLDFIFLQTFFFEDSYFLKQIKNFVFSSFDLPLKDDFNWSLSKNAVSSLKHHFLVFNFENSKDKIAFFNFICKDFYNRFGFILNDAEEFFKNK